MTVRCPAKVNTFLSVGPPDSSGYHPVRTVLQAIGLFDSLTIERAEHDSFVCHGQIVPEDNTVTKALRLLREIVPVPPIAVTLDKQIPSEAGLGGGSSDAAGLIRAIKRLVPDVLSDQFAYEVACAVGSDVPFFLVGGRAKATGYGECVTPLPDTDELWIVIVKPHESVPTAMAYSRLDAVAREWQDFSDAFYNDFERVAPCVCAEISERLVAAGAEESLLSGSGSAVFGTFGTPESARSAKSRLNREGFDQCWAVPTLTRSESLWMS